MIFKKVSLVSAKWLKYMLLKLQKYNLQVQYKKGAEMHTAYFLSRTFTDNNDEKKKNNIRMHQQVKQMVWPPWQ